MTMDSYDIVKKDKSIYFDAEDDDSTLSDCLYDEKSDSLYRSSISNLEFSSKFNILPKHLESYQGTRKSILDKLRLTVNDNDNDDLGLPVIISNSNSNKISLYDNKNNNNNFNQFMKKPNENEFANSLLVPKYNSNTSSLTHHSQWKLNKLLLGHSGQVTALTIDPLNKFFVTGSSDRTMKIWDLATGELQLTLSGHIMAIRGIVISDRHPYMFSCSEDKTIKCWDLEKNKVVRDYHGHLSSVYSIDIHPTLDLIVTAGRDSAIRVWDIRTRLPVYTLTGHNNTVNQVKCRGVDPQIISCSMDSTVRTWDLIAGKCDKTLTYHSKSVRSFFINENKKELITGSSDGIKKFNLPNCDYLQELEYLKNDKIKEGNLIINSIVGNDDGVMFAGCDNGQYGFWDWDTGRIFQDDINIPIPGSLYAEKGILCSAFDRSGLRLITGNVDKSVKIWKQVDEDL